MIGRTAPNGDEVWIVGTPHFLEAWNANRYGKSRTATLTDQLGSWTYPPKNGFYEAMLDAPLDQTFYSVVRKRGGLKTDCFYLLPQHQKYDSWRSSGIGTYLRHATI